MRIYVVGAGGVGGWLGGMLARVGLDVSFVARGEHAQAMRKQGLQVKSVTGDWVVKPAKVIESISDIVDPELIIFTVKTYDTARVAPQLAEVMTDKTSIISFQNGVDSDEQIKQFVKKGSVYPGVAYIVSARTAPGVIEQTGGLRKFIIGGREQGVDSRLQQVVTMLQTAKLDAALSEDITRDLWKKFLFIIPFAGMTALCRSPIGPILAQLQTKASLERLLNEAIAVAQACQVALPTTIFDDVRDTINYMEPHAKASLLVDLEQGRHTEIEALHGAVVRYARELELDVPLNELVYGAIRVQSV
jgi:2-dehydropantoate 2-reductase